MSRKLDFCKKKFIKWLFVLIEWLNLTNRGFMWAWRVLQFSNFSSMCNMMMSITELLIKNTLHIFCVISIFFHMIEYNINFLNKYQIFKWIYNHDHWLWNFKLKPTYQNKKYDNLHLPSQIDEQIFLPRK